MSRFFSEALSGLTPYTPGEQPRDTQYIKLNTNESPYPPSPRAVELAAAAAKSVNLYSDPSCFAFTRALADRLSLTPEEIICGNGSDEILFFAFSAFCAGGGEAAYPNITYGFYDSTASLCGARVTKLPLNADLTIDAEAYAGLGKTIFLANPNAPTGIALPLRELEEIIRRNPDNVVVVDEAYVDFGAESAAPLIRKYDNLLVVQTFSKSCSMAGARLGIGLGCPELIRDLNAVKYALNPYNVNKMTQAAGLGALEDWDYIQSCRREIMETRAYTQERLAALGFAFPDSKANFVFAKHPDLGGKEIYLRLRERGILVRHFDAPLTRDYNRITIGTRGQMDALLEALASILEETK